MAGLRSGEFLGSDWESGAQGIGHFHTTWGLSFDLNRFIPKLDRQKKKIPVKFIFSKAFYSSTV